MCMYTDIYTERERESYTSHVPSNAYVCYTCVWHCHGVASAMAHP